MLVKRARERDWSPTDYAGIDRALFRNNDAGGRSSVLRLRQGTAFPRHGHERTEEVVVLEGRVRIGDVELEAGDYLFTTPGEEHDVEARTEAVIFVSSQGATPLAK